MSLIPRRSPRLAQMGKSKLDHSHANKENVENMGPSKGSRKRKGESIIASTKRHATVDQENEAGRREGMACASVKTMTVRDTDEDGAVAMDVDDLLALKFTSNKHDYKSRLEERMKYSAMLKQRIRDQVAHASQLDSLAQEKLAETEAELAQMDQEIIDLQQKESELDEERQAQEVARDAQQDVLKSHQETRADVYEDLLNLETELASLTEATEKAAAHVEEARNAVIFATQETSRLGERNDKLQEYNRSLQEYNTKMQNDLKELQANHNRTIEEQVIAKRTLESMRSQGAVKETELETIKIVIETDESAITELKARNETLSNQLESQSALLAEATTAADAILTEVTEIREKNGTTQDEFDALAAKKKSVSEQMAADDQSLAAMRSEVDEMKTKLETADIESQNKLEEFNKLQKKIEKSEAEVRELNALKTESDKMQRKMRNKILDLKGTIRVFCRVKPCDEETVVTVIADPGNEGRIELSHNNKQLVFGFDRHFSSATDQLAIFDEVATHVEQTMNGVDSCILGFGSSGSGKTHTMLGSACDEGSAHRGVMPRAVQLMLGRISEMQSEGWEHTMKVTLAATAGAEMWEAGDRAQLLVGAGLEQVQEAHGRNISDYNQVSDLFSKAQKEAGSHLVMMVSVQGEHAAKGQKMNGSLVMCDISFEHTSSLKEVFTAIESNKKAAPFENSQLTRLLQPSLSQGGKASMIVHVDPSAAAAGHTLVALRFATQVNSCLLR